MGQDVEFDWFLPGFCRWMP